LVDCLIILANFPVPKQYEKNPFPTLIVTGCSPEHWEFQFFHTTEGQMCNFNSFKFDNKSFTTHLYLL